jgi:hypothetical protein
MDLSSSLLDGAIGVALSIIMGALFSIWFKIKELHEWHDVKDSEGVRIWYPRNKEMADTLQKIEALLSRFDHREERWMLIQNHQIETLEKHTVAINQLCAVVEALTRIVLK